jgi:tetratricopeptide (TPR) repeat protein
MSPISQRFAIPKNEDEFENLCLELLRLYWSRPKLFLFGKRGERQFGIDILDLGGQIPLVAAQCKLKEEHKNLAPSAIQKEVNEAKQFTLPIGKYGILTTAKVSTQAQRKVREINEAHLKAGLFEVELLTWERLCELLQKYPEVHEQFYGEIMPGRARSIEKSIVAVGNSLDSLTTAVGGNDVDSQINDARDNVNKREFQMATLLLNRIQQKSGSSLTSYQKFRVLSNLGAAAFGEGQYTEAAQFFLQAASCNPQDERARTNEVFAYYLSGDTEQTFQRANELRKEYPASTRLAVFWALTAPQDMPFSEIEGNINSVLQTDAEVSLALARRALMKFNFASATEYAKSAGEKLPQWSEPHILIAQIQIGKASGLGSSPREDKPNLALAIAQATKAIRLAEQEKSVPAQLEALVVRFEINILQGRKTEASEDARTAYQIDPNDINVLLALAQCQLDQGQVEDGLASLTKAYGMTPRADIVLMLGRTLATRGNEADLDRAISIFEGTNLEKIPALMRPPIATRTVQSMVMKKAWGRASTYLQGIETKVESVVVLELKGFLAHCQNQHQEAEQFALAARDQLSENTHPETKEFLARLFMQIGRPADALPLFQNLFDSEIPSFDPSHLLDCAARMHLDDKVLEVCDKLHTRGAVDWRLLEFEVPYLEKYDVEKGIRRLSEFLQSDPQHRVARLTLSVIGILHTRPELVHSSLDDLPRVEDLRVEHCRKAVGVLKSGKDAELAVDYAYRFLRRHFDEIDAHNAFIQSILDDPQPTVPSTLDIVQPGAAVCYVELPNGSPRWVVIEETGAPLSALDEISPTSPLAIELISKRVGDRFTLAKGAISTREAVIKQIMPKYVRRFQDSMGEMQIRFGPASAVESIQIGPPEEPIQQGLAKFLASIQARSAKVSELQSIYTNQPMSIHLFGGSFGQNAYSGLVNLALMEGQVVKCCMGTDEEREQAALALRTANTVVVDLSAIATLRLLGLERILATKKFRLVMSEGTWAELNMTLKESTSHSLPGGTLGYQDGKYTLQELSAEANEQRKRENEVFLDQIRTNVETLPTTTLASVEPNTRESLVKLLGGYGAEALAIARNPDHVLWTDDIVQAQIAAELFGERRVWTQAFLAALADAGFLSRLEYSQATAKLVGMEYIATGFDIPAIFEAVRLSEFTPRRVPLKQFLETFSNHRGNVHSLFKLLAGFVVRFSQEQFLEAKRCLIIRSFLDAFWRNPAARGLLLSMRKFSSRLFGLNVIGQQEFDTCFDGWLNNTKSSIF